MRFRLRLGFTLVELLVVVGIIGVLLALLLPAVQRARESARAKQCGNNLRQIGIGLHGYHGVYGVFPPGCVGVRGDPVNVQGWGWAVFLLPYVEQQPLYDNLDAVQFSLQDVIYNPELQHFLRTPLPVFRCASDTGDDLQSDNRTLSGFVLEPTGETLATSLRVASKTSPRGMTGLACIMPPIGGFTSGDYGVKAATSNYVASFGDFWHPPDWVWSADDFQGNGVFGSNLAVAVQNIPDGASQTFAIGERSWQSFASIWAGTDGWNRCEREGVSMVMATAYYPMNIVPDPFYLSCDPQGAAGFGSEHPGGAHFLMVDGSVRFVSENIDFRNDRDPAQLGIFQKLARRNDGQSVDDF